MTLDLTAEKVQQPQPTTQTFSDTGEPEASDTDLDARIAGLLEDPVKNWGTGAG